MRKKRVKVIAASLLLAGASVFNTACGCGGKEVKITFVTEENSDIVRYVKKGKSLVDIPATPKVKGKYCAWDRDDFQNLQSDITVTAICHSTVTELTTNIPSTINVEVSSEEAKLENIFRDIEIDVKFESGETKKLYDGDYSIEAKNYNRDVGGTYIATLTYNNAKKDITINVVKKQNYVTVSLASNNGYYNEGLPQLIANTEVEGTVSFDPSQTLQIGNKQYNWTFVPLDTAKYAIVHGKITVNLLNASLITSNKSELVVDFGTTKEEIISELNNGLLIEGKYGEYFKPIESQYYRINSTDFVEDKSGVFNFRVSYDEETYVDIPVTVKKCEDYTLSVDDVNEYIVKVNDTLDSVIPYITKSSQYDGRIEFVEGQTLTVGNYDYQYKFTPNNAHFATKYGTIKIHAYKAQSIEFDEEIIVAYGSQETLINTMLKNREGKIYYNDGLVKDIDSNKASILINDGYNPLMAGNYDYSISYNDEISVLSEFTLSKRKLVLGVDFREPSCTQPVDPENYQIMPTCKIEKLSTTPIDFDVNLFKLIPISAEVVLEGRIYMYNVQLVPDDSIIDNYEIITFSFNALVY